jgi:hypothetical protein
MALLTVNCPSDAVAPTHPAVTDACGRAITPTVNLAISCLPVTVRWYIPSTYADCAGHTHDWTLYFYDCAPDFTLPVNGSSPLIVRAMQ